VHEAAESTLCSSDAVKASPLLQSTAGGASSNRQVVLRACSPAQVGKTGCNTISPTLVQLSGSHAFGGLPASTLNFSLIDVHASHVSMRSTRNAQMMYTLLEGHKGLVQPT
jgi:hypothetical protein